MFINFPDATTSITTSNPASTSSATSSSSFSDTQSHQPIPNIINQLDLKSSQLIGSLKSIQLILESSPIKSSVIGSQPWYKLKSYVRSFLFETNNYLKQQSQEMSTFLLENPAIIDENEEATHSNFQSIQQQIELKKKLLEEAVQVLSEVLESVNSFVEINPSSPSGSNSSSSSSSLSSSSPESNSPNKIS